MVNSNQALQNLLLNGSSSEATASSVLQTVQPIYRTRSPRKERDIHDTELYSNSAVDRSTPRVFAAHQLLARGAPIPPNVSHLLIISLCSFIQLRPRVYPRHGHNSLLGLGSVRGCRHPPTIPTLLKRALDDFSITFSAHRILGPVRAPEVPIDILPLHRVPVLLLATGSGKSRISVAELASFW
jgi:hypothetical protein